MSRSLGADGVDGAVADEHVAGADPLEPGEHPQRGRLARARRADEHHQLAVGHVEREVLDGGHVAVALARVLEAHRRHQPFTAPESIPRMKWRWRNR